MTIPSRPAPPPPQASSSHKPTTNRYSPATNWDDAPFGSSATTMVKKAPPPRPPPPKVVPALKKPGQAQSINILSNLFGGGQKRSASSAKPPVSQKPVLMKLPPPPKLPPPNHHSSTTNGTAASSELISFDSPPSSPTFTQKSCSDCISVDSFSSDSNYSSPNNGNMSQAESGFEDDFVVTTEHGRRSKVTTPSTIATISTSSSSSRDLWDLSDPFGMPTSSSSSNSTIYAPVGSATIRVPMVNSKLASASDFIDPLCNGKTVATKVQTIAKPTIIKSAGSTTSSQKSTPVHQLEIKPKPVLTPPVWSIKPAGPAVAPVPAPDDDEEESLDSLPSLPMPNIPPPPPPVIVDEEEETHQEPYGVAMYDFHGETDEDLSFRTNDKIYLVKRLNEEWLLGRDRRGCEGMFPANYIEVRIALPGDRQPVATTSSSSSSSFNPPKVRIMYTFNAEVPDDLTIVENEFVTVLHQINAEWLYGESRGQRGQFPANFIEYVPANLPLVPPPVTN